MDPQPLHTQRPSQVPLLQTNWRHLRCPRTSDQERHLFGSAAFPFFPRANRDHHVEVGPLGPSQPSRFVSPPVFDLPRCFAQPDAPEIACPLLTCAAQSNFAPISEFTPRGSFGCASRGKTVCASAAKGRSRASVRLVTKRCIFKLRRHIE
jgi:hypothetical protein